MKSIALLALILTTATVLSGPYYDTQTSKVYPSKSRIPEGRGQSSGLRNMSDAELATFGIHAVVDDPAPDGMVRTGWESQPTIIDGIAHRVPTTITQAEYDAQQAAQQTAELHEAYQQIGASVTAIRALLVALNLGYDLPCDSATVLAELTTKALTGQLTAAQRDAKNDLADLYLMLRGSGVTDSQIAAMWEYIKAGGQ